MCYLPNSCLKSQDYRTGRRLQSETHGPGKNTCIIWMSLMCNQGALRLPQQRSGWFSDRVCYEHWYRASVLILYATVSLFNRHIFKTLSTGVLLFKKLCLMLLKLLKKRGNSNFELDLRWFLRITTSTLGSHPQKISAVREHFDMLSPNNNTSLKSASERLVS